MFTILAVYKHCDEIRQERGKPKSPNRNDEFAIDPDRAGGNDIFGAICDFKTDSKIGITQVGVIRHKSQSHDGNFQLEIY